MKIKIKYLLMALLAVGLFVYAGISAFAQGPSAYVRYNNSGIGVVAYVYWDDTDGDGYSFDWAEDMNSSGSDLDWKTDGVTRVNQNKANNYVAITLTKYKNYFFKIYNQSDLTVVRSFPGDYNNEVNPDRKQNDYAHGNFTPDTTMCGICHSTHSSLKSQLLKQATYYDLCMLCHSNSNSQSKYDVELGMVYMGSINKWKDSLAGPIRVGAEAGMASSAHDVNDNFNTTVQVPGSDPDPSKVLSFNCISCHTAHGGTNDNYRLLRKTIYPANGNWNGQTVNFSAFAVVKNLSVGEEVGLISGNSEFCLACHLDYSKGNAMFSGGDYGVFNRHPVSVGSTVYSVFSTSPVKDLYPTIGDNLPLQYYEAGESKTSDKRTAVVCETCHFAHGTRRSFVINGNENGGKNILRLDNYGVCESCHKK